LAVKGRKNFSRFRRAWKNFLLSASLQPLTANSDCAHGGQPKSPRPISAGRHVFILGPGASRRKEHGMNEYRIELYDQNGNQQRDHIDARSAQEAADKIRAEWKNCYILRISLVVQDWK
jgi:hypothetical protein